MKKTFLIFFCIIAASHFMLSYGAQLSVERYVEMVVAQNKDIRALDKSIEAVQAQMRQARRIYSPVFEAGFSYFQDESHRVPNISRSRGPSYNLSIAQELSTGTIVAVGYNRSHIRNRFSAAALGTQAESRVDMYPFISVEQSIFRNFGGGAAQAGVLRAEAQARAQLYTLLYQRQQMVLSATMAYWNLSYARALVEFRQNSIERNRTILNWNRRRHSLDLINLTDYLQSQAAYQQRHYNLILAREQYVASARQFNNFLNIAGNNVIYRVEALTDAGRRYLTYEQTLSRQGVRADVLSAQAVAQSTMYAAREVRRGIGHELIVLGSYALTGIAANASTARNHVWNADRPSFVVGARYSLPLDFSTRRTVRRGFDLAETAALATVSALVTSEQNDWLALSDNWRFARERLKLLHEIVNVQTRRHRESQSMLTRGRLTTYEALQSEQDLDDATLSLLANILEVITIYETNRALYFTQEQF
ncbi:MAG: TolC family protein [Elusimicrobia bacterium]|nr:TolC family protein [Elusimicrobiota bacterium]